MLPLGDYGVIGNDVSAALVSRLGSVDWCCFPALDSASHFGALLDDPKGGRFAIQPQGEFRSEQRYLPGTQVLETVFETPTGRGVLTDWMPLEERVMERPALYRKLATVAGRVKWNVLCAPRFGGGKSMSEVERARGHVLFRGAVAEDLAFLVSDQPLEIDRDRGFATCRLDFAAGRSARFNWVWGRSADLPVSPALEPTVECHQSFVHRCPKEEACPLSGPWHDILARSGLLLKILTVRCSGALCESVVPSRAGEPLLTHLWNSPQLLRALSALGLEAERDAYFGWLCDVLERDRAPGLESAYGLDSRRLPGKQAKVFPLGILGQLALSIREQYLLTSTLPQRAGPALEEIAEFASQAWRRPDHDPLEPPSRPEHFVSSKVLCWTALDCACTLLTNPEPRWLREREILWQTIIQQGFDTDAGSFVRSFSSREIGIGALYVPLLGQLSPDDPRVKGTLKAVSKKLSGKSGQLLKGSLLLVSALARCGRFEEAAELLADLCPRASPLGFFAEELAGSELYGAFPSASVHAQMIGAALDIHVAATPTQRPSRIRRPA